MINRRNFYCKVLVAVIVPWFAAQTWKIGSFLHEQQQKYVSSSSQEESTGDIVARVVTVNDRKAEKDDDTNVASRIVADDAAAITTTTATTNPTRNETSGDSESASPEKTTAEKQNEKDSKILASFQYWNVDQQVLQFPPDHPQANGYNARTVPLSLEILERVLRDKMDDESCFHPQMNRTWNLVQQVDRGLTNMTYPVLNVGMPKVGSTSLQWFFHCHGRAMFQKRTATHDQLGDCMHRAVARGNVTPILACTSKPNAIAHLQMDCNWPLNFELEKGQQLSCLGCSYPQISLLDELHEEFPNAPFILMFRPVKDWLQSSLGWHNNLVRRWGYCQIPGLYHYEDNRPLTEQHLKDWWCSHVHHIREFVKYHPSHPLIELDLYQNHDTERILSALFHAKPSCWNAVNQRNITEKTQSVQQNVQNALAQD